MSSLVLLFSFWKSTGRSEEQTDHAALFVPRVRRNEKAGRGGLERRTRC